MSILITRENKIVEYNPAGTMSIDEIARVIDIDPYSLVFNSDAHFCIVASSIEKNAGINSIASLYCEKPIYGDALFMSGTEIVSNKKTLMHMNEYNSLLDTKTFNGMMISAFKNVVTQLNKLYGSDCGITINKKVVYLDLDDLYDKMLGEEDDDDEYGVRRKKKKYKFSDWGSIVEKAYKGIEKIGQIIDADDCTLFQDKDTIIKLDPELAQETIAIMIEYFVGKEEYEKCAFLHDIKFIKK